MIVAEAEDFWGKEIPADLSAFFRGWRNQKKTRRVSVTDDNSETFEKHSELGLCQMVF